MNLTMIAEIVAELTTELEETDDQFSSSLLNSKVVSAYREVQRTRNYPSYYTEEMITSDMERYYSVVRDVALYDYSQIGMEFQTRNAENEVVRTFADRDSLFNGVIPLSKI